MTEARNAEARKLITTQLDALSDDIKKWEKRIASLRTQTANAEGERALLKDEIVGLADALEALGGRIPDEEIEAEA